MERKLIAAAVSSALALPMAAQAVEFSVSGHVNRSIVSVEAGADDDGELKHVDANPSETRFHFTHSEDLGNGMAAGVHMELGRPLGGPSWLVGATNWCAYNIYKANPTCQTNDRDRLDVLRYDTPSIDAVSIVVMSESFVAGAWTQHDDGPTSADDQYQYVEQDHSYMSESFVASAWTQHSDGPTALDATAGVKWSEFGQFENVARKGDGGPVPSRQAAKKTVSQRDIEEDARRSPALPLRPFSYTFGTALTLDDEYQYVEQDHSYMSESSVASAWTQHSDGLTALDDEYQNVEQDHSYMSESFVASAWTQHGDGPTSADNEYQFVEQNNSYGDGSVGIYYKRGLYATERGDSLWDVGVGHSMGSGATAYAGFGKLAHGP